MHFGQCRGDPKPAHRVPPTLHTVCTRKRGNSILNSPHRAPGLNQGVQWHAIIAFEIPEPELKEEGDVVGVDVGLRPLNR